MKSTAFEAAQNFLGLIRFSHTVFALPFAAATLVLALKHPMPNAEIAGDLPRLTIPMGFGLLLCMVSARSAAMAINRLADHRFDAANPRTADRHLPAGVMSRRSVWIMTLVCVILFFIGCAMFLPNWLPLAAAVPVLLWLGAYSFAKRFTNWPHVWLGVALALSPICVWAAVRGPRSLDPISDYALPMTVAAMVAFWVSGFDILYSCQDAAFDRQAGLFSVPQRFGISRALAIAKAFHFAMVPLLILVGWLGGDAGLHWVYWIASIVIAGMVIYQHALVRAEDLSRAGVAFFHTNAVISLTFLTAVFLDCIWL